jgi:hypothetical protein
MQQSESSRRSLPPGALHYVRDQLWLARGLEPYLDDVLASNEWDSWTYADPSVPAPRLERFSEGGALSSTDVHPHVWKDIAAAMAAEAPAAWLVPDPLGRPDDAFLKDLTVPNCVVDDAVYYIARTGEIDRIAATWRQAGSAAGQLGLITNYELPSAGMNAADLRAAAEQTFLLAVSAYDGDGTLLLEKKSRH